jgi:REP element-mobilizing transposase RayT
MKYDPNINHRRSIRLKGFDYSSKGMYFVTICTQNRENLFGEIVSDKMVLNIAGKMVERWYLELTNKYSNLQCGVNIIMPNHFHCIVEIVGADLCVCPELPQITQSIEIQGRHAGLPLPEIIQWFKTMTTNEYIKMVKQNLLPPFNKRIWQRNYYEHIIRDEDEYYRVIEYIQNNPMLWGNDCYYH